MKFTIRSSSIEHDPCQSHKDFIKFDIMKEAKQIQATFYLSKRSHIIQTNILQCWPRKT